MIPWDLKAFFTPFRTDEVAPNLLCSLDSDRYFPYESDSGLLADFARCGCRDVGVQADLKRQLAAVEAAPAFFSPLWEIGP